MWGRGLTFCCSGKLKALQIAGTGGYLTVGRLVFKNMAFYGYHGVFAAEKEVGRQRVEVDVELHSDFESAARADDVELRHQLC